jgi:hypothetical protein
MRSWAQRATLAGIVAALAWPVLINSDGFPLSTYPLFLIAFAPMFPLERLVQRFETLSA